MTSGDRDKKNVFSSVTWKLYSGTEIAVVFLKTNMLIKDEIKGVRLSVHVCQPSYNVSSLLLLVGNRDDSNRDDKRYANSHLLCFLEAKT